MATFSFTGPGGSDPSRDLQQLRTAATPTEGDALYAIQRHKSRIVQRTQRGVDVNGARFADYRSNARLSCFTKGKFCNSAGNP